MISFHTVAITILDTTTINTTTAKVATAATGVPALTSALVDAAVVPAFPVLNLAGLSRVPCLALTLACVRSEKTGGVLRCARYSR